MVDLEGGTTDIHYSRENQKPIRDSVNYELTEEKAQKLFNYIQTLSLKKVNFYPFSYNCVDFANSLYQATGQKGNMLSGLNHEVPLHLFDEDSLTNSAKIYAYYRFYDLRPLLSAIYEQYYNREADKKVIFWKLAIGQKTEVSQAQDPTTADKAKPINI